jgi:hypothetical protein
MPTKSSVCEHGHLARSCEICERDAEIVRLRAQVARLEADGIHSCHDDCPRLACVLGREKRAAEAEVERLRAFIRDLVKADIPSTKLTLLAGSPGAKDDDGVCFGDKCYLPWWAHDIANDLLGQAKAAKGGKP